MSLKEEFTLSSLSLSSSDDWDRSDGDISPVNIQSRRRPTTTATPQNSVAFPVGEGVEDTTPERIQSRCGGGGSKEGRSLSELMRLHAEKGTGVTFSAEEATRVADVLKQWINSGTSPYEDEDDFFTRAHDDASWRLKRSSRPPMELNGRPRGQSETLTLRLATPESASS